MRKFLTILTVTAITATAFMSCEKEDEYAISKSELNKGIVYVPDSLGNEYEAVDMGFQTKLCWATCNMGATSPEQNGHFYSWGETQPKDNYTWYQYKWADYANAGLSRYGLLKYTSDTFSKILDEQTKEPITPDNKTKLDTQDDCAAAQRGGGWRIPTKEEFIYMYQHTTRRYAKLNGVAGYIFTSTVTGYEDRSIFFPFSGSMDNHPGDKQSKHLHEGRIGRYWTNTRCSSPAYQADVFSIQNTDDDPAITNAGIGSQDRNIGLPVRPVVRVVK